MRPHVTSNHAPAAAVSVHIAEVHAGAILQQYDLHWQFTVALRIAAAGRRHRAKLWTHRSRRSSLRKESGTLRGTAGSVAWACAHRGLRWSADCRRHRARRVQRDSAWAACRQLRLSRCTQGVFRNARCPYSGGHLIGACNCAWTLHMLLWHSSGAAVWCDKYARQRVVSIRKVPWVTEL